MTALPVAVLGAGAAGLSAALALRDRGREAVLLEAADRAGGKLGTLREGGWLIERAALGLLDRVGDLSPLAERLGLTPLPAAAAAQTRWVVRDGKLRALPSGIFSFLGSRLLTLGEKLRLLREPWVPRGDPSGESVRAFFQRRLGAGGAFLADALQTGIYAGDADRLELESCFPLLAQLERDHGSLLRGMRARAREARRAGALRRAPARLSSFAGGMEALVEKLAAAVAPALRLQARVRSIHFVNDCYRISLLDHGALAELSASALVIALPAPDAARALETLDPALAAGLRELKAAPVTSVHLGVRALEVAGSTAGFGLLSPGRPVLGTLLPSSLWEGRAPPGRVLLSTLVGGARSPELAGLPDQDLLNVVRDELARTVRLRRDAEPEHLRIVRWPEAVPQYETGHRLRVARLEALAAAHPRLRLAGSWYHGVSVLDCLRDGRAQADALVDAG